MRRLVRLLLFLAVTFVAAQPALTQDLDPPDYRAWDSLVSRAERVIDANRATESQLDAMRRSLVEWRDRFTAAEQQNATRIDTLNRQLGALGPPPGEGEREPEEIEARRTELQQTLADLRAPRIRASEAYSEADGLIAEIDEELRQRNTERLLRRMPTPLNPLNWAFVLSDFAQTVQRIPAELADRFREPERRGELYANLPATILLLLLSAALFVRGQIVTDWLETRADTIVGPVRRMLASSIVLILQLAVPWAGLLALLGAVRVSGVPGEATRALVAAIPVAGLTLIIGYWLVRRLFPLAPTKSPPMPIPGDALRKGRRAAVGIATLLAAGILVEMFLVRAEADPLTVGYADVAVIVPMAFLLYRLGLALRRVGRPESADITDTPSFGERATRVLGDAARLVSIAALTAGAIGHLELMDVLVVSSTVTLALFGAVTLLQRLFARVYGLATTGQDAPADSLVPTLMGGVLAIAALPVLGLIWGMRITDLTELWANIRSGVVLGGTRISPEAIFVLILVFAVGFALTRLVQNVLRNTILPKTSLDQGARTAVVSGLGYLGVFLAALAAITIAGINLSSLAIVAGALSVGIGFGLQNVVSNFVSGIILLVERPVSEGDWIEVGGQMGYVRRIAVRATVIETFDRTDVIVPNSDLVSGHVTNWTRGNLVGRVIVPVGVAYGTETERVDKILHEIAMAHPMVVLQPPPQVLFMGFGPDSLQFEIRAILRDINYILSVRSEMNHEIARRFADEGIEIPFGQRDIWIRNPEALQALVSPRPRLADERGADPVPIQRSGQSA